jgi:hypothetical protein
VAATSLAQNTRRKHERGWLEGARKALASPALIAVQIETGQAAVENDVLEMMEAQGFVACVYAPDRRELKATGALSPHNTSFVKDLAAAQARVRGAAPGGCVRQTVLMRLPLEPRRLRRGGPAARPFGGRPKRPIGRSSDGNR